MDAADPGHGYDPHAPHGPGPVSCSECGFEPTSDPQRVAARCDVYPGIVEDLLASTVSEVARLRRAPNVWSPIEYAAHISEAMNWYVERITRVIDEDRPQLCAFDFDAAADEGEYCCRSIDTVVEDVLGACRTLAELARSLDGDQLSRCGVGSDGSPRSVAMLLARAEHELVHHELDLRRGLGLAPTQ